jgi:uncharacterized repeat protein (TIGR03803 family)
LYSFAGGSDGQYPAGNIACDSTGKLYGSTESGGAYRAGTIFELSPTSSGGWTESVLYTFTGGNDGGGPLGGVTLDPAGNLYGTTVGGGENEFGTVFELSPSSNGGWSFNTIHTFSGPDGADSYTPVTVYAGNLYGTTRIGGTHDYGVVFEMKQDASGAWSESVLYSFDGGKDEGLPMTGVAFDAYGNLYGTTIGVAEDAPGVVFELIRQSDGKWKINVFVDIGYGPLGAPILDPAGNVYGTTIEGGYGYGNVYELEPEPGGRWKDDYNLRVFSGGTDGSRPASALVRDPEGNLYGVTSSGGATGNGVAYELVYASSPYWNELELYSFKGGNDGSLPETLLAGASGIFYGTTQFGGENSLGTVFAITLQ